MGPSGMGPGEVQDRGLSQIPSTPKGAFDWHTDTQPTNHKSIPLDSKTWVSLDGQLLWGWRKFNTDFYGNYIHESTLVH